MLYEMERDVESEIQQQMEDLIQPQISVNSLKLKPQGSQDYSVLDHMQRQLVQDSNQRSNQEEGNSEDNSQSMVYTCNVFLKYLETLYSLTPRKKKDQVQKELRTIEGILLTRLKASFEQSKKIEELIRQYVEHTKKNFLKKGNTAFLNKFNKKKNAAKP